MAPEIGAMRDALVVDFDDVIGRGNLVVVAQFDDAGVVAVDSEFGSAGQHPFAFDAGDEFLAERNVDCADAGAAVGRAADDGPAAVACGFDDRFYTL